MNLYFQNIIRLDVDHATSLTLDMNNLKCNEVSTFSSNKDRFMYDV